MARGLAATDSGGEVMNNRWFFEPAVMSFEIEDIRLSYDCDARF
jgi:hypothetical protein